MPILPWIWIQLQYILASKAHMLHVPNSHMPIIQNTAWCGELLWYNPFKVLLLKQTTFQTKGTCSTHSWKRSLFSLILKTIPTNVQRTLKIFPLVPCSPPNESIHQATSFWWPPHKTRSKSQLPFPGNHSPLAPSPVTLGSSLPWRLLWKMSCPQFQTPGWTWRRAPRRAQSLHQSQPCLVRIQPLCCIIYFRKELPNPGAQTGG